GCCLRNGCTSEGVEPNFCSTFHARSAYPRSVCAFWTALRILDAATSSIAFVTWRVALMDFILRRRSRRLLAIEGLFRKSLLTLEALCETLQLLFTVFRHFFAELLQYIEVLGTEQCEEFRFEPLHILDSDIIDETVCRDVDDRDLLA